MRTLWYSLPVLCLLGPTPAWAQHPRDDRGASYPYGYEYSPWQTSQWSSLEYRTKCEGEQVRGTETGPIHWMAEFRNRATEQLSFDYVILPPGANKHPSASGRGHIKPGKEFTRLAVVPTTRCDEGVVIKLDNVRIGADVDSVAYRIPDRAG